jgi:hypothetical protein
MAHAEYEVFINRPRSEVFDFVADGLNNLRWRPGIAELNLISGKPDAPGATYRQLLIGPFGRRINADYRLTKVERNQEINFELIAGSIQPKGAFYFEVIGAGTVLRFELYYNPTGWHVWKEPIAAWLLEREVRNLEVPQHAPAIPTCPPTTIPPPPSSHFSPQYSQRPRHSRAGGNPVQKDKVLLCFFVFRSGLRPATSSFATKGTESLGVESATRLPSGGCGRRRNISLWSAPSCFLAEEGAEFRLIPTAPTSSQSVAADTPNPTK